jgi:ABC-type branched-subunit amino acid transport system ATPase component/ABC-type branched-subunit amino acid transport system permease subunit
VFKASALLIYALLGLSLVVLSGWAGSVSLGHVAFFAIGAAAGGAVLTAWDADLFVAMVVAAVVGAAVAALVGVPTLRLRGLYLAVTTFAFALATTSYLLNDDVFGWVPDERVERAPFLGGLEVSSEVSVYYLALAVLVVVMVGVRGVRAGRFGRALLALRDNERAAQAYAVDVARVRLAAFSLSGAIAALAGALFVHHERAFDGSSYSPIENLAVFTMVVVGGMGSIAGAVLGALFLLGARWFLDTEWQFLASGVGVLLVLLIAPGGLVSVALRVRDAALRAVANRSSLTVPGFTASPADAPLAAPAPAPGSAAPPATPAAAAAAGSAPGAAGSAPSAGSAAGAAGSAPSAGSAPAAPAPGAGAAATTSGPPAAAGAGRARDGDAEPTAARGSPTPSNAGGDLLLDVRGVEVGYGGVPVLFGVDLGVRRGEVVALLGTNGAGKSTLLRAISGLATPDAGQVLLDGDDITGEPAHVVAGRGVGQMPGGAGVFPTLSVADNLRVAGWLHRRDRSGAAAPLARLQRLFPVLRDRADEQAGNLSGGQQQMLALAMAVLARPRLLMIDELSLGLAPAVVGQLLRFVDQLRAEGVTLVVVEQSVNVALDIADRAVFLERGEVRFAGPAADLLDRPDLLRSVFLGAAAGAAPAGATPAPAVTPAPATPAPATTPPPATTPAPASTPAVAATTPRGATSADDPAPHAGGGDASAAGPGATGAGPVLQVTGVSVAFGGVRAVEDVSLAVAPGEIVGIIGPNGAGKTTLFDALSGFVPLSGGRIALAGRDVGHLQAPGRARRGLGRSFQDARLFASMTVDETIAVALERWVKVGDPLSAAFHLPNAVDSEHAVRRRVDQLVDLLGLAPYRSLFVGELSTGTRRVVDLACLLAHRPRVVLLDEPASGIAQREVEQLAPLIRRIRDESDASLVVVEHDIPLVLAVADRLVAMDQGRVVAVGPPAEVLADPAVLASYLGDDQTAIHRSGTGRTTATPDP